MINRCFPSTKMVIENWDLVQLPRSPYQAPELQKFVVRGNVYGHPKYPNGRFITTSYIKECHDKTVRTCNSEYELGAPNPKFVAWHKKKYPNSKLDWQNPFPWRM